MRSENSRGVIAHNVVKMRAEPESASEQVSQAICNAPVEILERQRDYLRIQTEEGYSGWVLGSQVSVQREYVEARHGDAAPDGTLCRVVTPFSELFASPHTDRLLTKLVFDTRLFVPGSALQESFAPVTLPGYGPGFVSSACLIRESDRPATFDDAVKYALGFVGTPYLWGGSTPFGFDCSGLVQRVFSMLGVILPRDAHQQADSPLGMRFPEDNVFQQGDLVFFRGASDPRGRGITHVGMMLDGLSLIHSYGKTGVTVHRLNDPEIVNHYQCLGGWRYPASAFHKARLDE